ncbi:Hypothetical predicted protein [Scomber scombrus]|uniref:Uncharacterized protein n=1 Tax=Scomber scombrus TaxID=13677 RepID=A0AAV1NL07_SCOSC
MVNKSNTLQWLVRSLHLIVRTHRRLGGKQLSTAHERGQKKTVGGSHQFGHLIRSKAETVLDPNLLCLFIPIVQNRPAAYKTRAGVMVYMRPDVRMIQINHFCLQLLLRRVSSQYDSSVLRALTFMETPRAHSAPSLLPLLCW